MPEFQCLSCNRVLNEKDLLEFRGGVRCPYCGFRILKKSRSKNVVKQIVAE
ncbi:MAG: DNA-directed RNA polymerase subunit P [Candidatus Brockarchaeota archaeon]|nr:DNA-directed RNA polymerase subunit P [Candidatus Brockarchaeota archaeon]